MDGIEKQGFVRKAATDRKVKWSRHALARLVSQEFSTTDVEFALRGGEVIED